MTEITVDKVRHEIQFFPFIVALIAAPAITGAPGIAVGFAADHFGFGGFVLIIPAIILSGALFIGAVPYLVIGVPGLIYALRRKGRHAPTGAFAFLGHVASIPAIFGLALVLEGRDAFGFTFFYLAFGCVFAPLWGWLFGKIYNAILDRGDAAHV